MLTLAHHAKLSFQEKVRYHALLRALQLPTHVMYLISSKEALDKAVEDEGRARQSDWFERKELYLKRSGWYMELASLLEKMGV